MKNKIDLDNVEKIVNWIRQEQKANPEGIKNVFGGTDENTALALEALPKLINVLWQIQTAPQPCNDFEFGSFVCTAQHLANEALFLFTETTKP